MCLKAILSLIPPTAFLMPLKPIIFCKSWSFVTTFKRKLLPSTQELYLLQWQIKVSMWYRTAITNMPEST